MKEHPEVRALLMLALILMAAGPALGVDHQTMHAWWKSASDTSRNNPKKIKMAMVADEAFDLAACYLWYFPPFEGEGEAVAGKVKVILKATGDRGTRKLGAGKSTLASLGTLVGWGDSPSVDYEWIARNGYRFQFKRRGTFPARVNPGDILLWTVKFTGMPPVETPSDGDVYIHSWCESCGTVKTPCPDYWTNDD